MAVDVEHRLLVQELQNRIEAQSEWLGFTRGRIANWYGQMLTSLVLAIDSRPIEYLTAGCSTEDGNFTAKIAVFLHDSIVIVDAAGKVLVDECVHSTTVRRRHALERYSLAATESVFSQELFPDWPGKLSADLVYSDGFTLNIPLGRCEVQKYRDELETLLGTLHRDLHEHEVSRV